MAPTRLSDLMRGGLSRDPKMRGLLDVVSVPKDATAKIALSLAQLGVTDARSAGILYGAGLHGQSVYFLQQSVEKSAKSMALLMGAIPNDPNVIVNEVGHRAALALLRGVPKLTKTAIRANETLQRTKTAENVPGSPLKSVFGRFDQKVEARAKILAPSLAQSQNDLIEATNLTDKKMWRPTLMLERSNKWVRAALEGLEEKPAFGGITSSLGNLGLSVYAMAGMLKEADLRKSRFVNYIGSGLRYAFWLPFILDWHWMATRYPPLSPADYWTAEAYTSEAPLVKSVPKLRKFASSLAEDAVAASRAARDYRTLAGAGHVR